MHQPCFVCGTTARETRLRWFEILYYRITDWICERCLRLGEAEDSGEAGEAWDR